MLGKNNYQERLQNMVKQDHFAIRKLSVGAMSILLGFAFLANSQVVKADTVTPNYQETQEVSNVKKRKAKVNQDKLTNYSDLNSFLKTDNNVKVAKTQPAVDNNDNNLPAESVKAKDKPQVNKTTVKGDLTPATQTENNHIHWGKWNSIDVAYNDEIQTLTLMGGSENAPAVMIPSKGRNVLTPLVRFCQTDLGCQGNVIKQIILKGKIKAQGIAAGLFADFNSLTSIEGLTNLDTSDVTHMHGMFTNDEELTNLDLSHFNTSKVTDMGYMFSGCRKLTNLDLSAFNTSNVKSMGFMFEECSKLVNLDLSNFDTSKVTSMSFMFSNCENLVNVNLSSFNTSKVTNLCFMFNMCSSLANINISHFNTSLVTNISGMFLDCTSLTDLDLSHFDTSNVTKMTDIFWGCTNLTNLDLSGFNTSKVTDMSNMFSRCTSLTSLDLSSFDTSNVIDMTSMFSSCQSLTNINISKLNTSKVTEMVQMFADCSSLTKLDLSNFDTSKVMNMSGMFASCSSLRDLNISHFNTCYVINMNSMFRECSNLTSLDLSHLNTQIVSDMGNMFSDCTSLTSLDLSGFDTSIVGDMSAMFYNCSKLVNLNISHFNTFLVTKMSKMFMGCSSLANLDLSHFNTIYLSDMTDMFRNCSSLTSLDLSHFNTVHVTDMADMFSGCSRLQRLSLSKDFSFLQNTGLEQLLGKWINCGLTNKELAKASKQWSSKEFVNNYSGVTDYDTYTRLKNLIKIQYRDQNGERIPDAVDEPQYGNIGSSLTGKISPDSPTSFKRKDFPGYRFDHAEINGKKVDLANIKYMEKPQTVTLFYTRVDSANNSSGNSSSIGSIGAANSTPSTSLSDSKSSTSSKKSKSHKDSASSSLVASTKDITLKHNAYLYDNNASRFTGIILAAGSVIASSGVETIKDQQYYVLMDKVNNKKYYVSASNAKPIVQELKRNAYVYNKYGQRIKNAEVLKQGSRINTFGNPVTIRGCQYFAINKGRFVKADDIFTKIVKTMGVAAGDADPVPAANKTVMHNAYLYDNQGMRANGIIILNGSKVDTYGLIKINGKLYYDLANGIYLATDNIDSVNLKLKSNAYIYDQYGSRISKQALKKGKAVKTYGKAVTIKQKKYYVIAKNKFVKAANFR